MITSEEAKEYMLNVFKVPKEYFGKEGETKKLFTDYPITELGDKEFQEAPIRECELIHYDGNKYCYVKVEGIEKEIKRGYIYTKPGRCGEVDCISIEEINKLLMKETFEDYLQRLKDRRTEDDYKYTDEDFKNRIHYIFDCYEKDLSVYKCLEFMYFVEREIKAEDVFNDQKKEGLKEFIDKHKQEWSKSTGDIFSDYTIGESKSIQNSMHLDAEIACRSMYRQETLEETIDKASLLEFPIKEWYRSDDYSREEVTAARDGFKRGAKWQQEQHDFLPGLTKQFDPKEGEMNGEEWTAVHFLKWLELNKFKIVK